MKHDALLPALFAAAVSAVSFPLLAQQPLEARILALDAKGKYAEALVSCKIQMTG